MMENNLMMNLFSRYFLRQFLFGAFLFVYFSGRAQNNRIGFLYNDSKADHEEIKAVQEFITSLANVEVEAISLDELKSSKLRNIDHLWYHRPDTLEVLPIEKKVGKTIRKFVSKGGNLLLTLDAVRLLNSWEIGR